MYGGFTPAKMADPRTRFLIVEMVMQSNEVLRFWFEELSDKEKWTSGAKLDKTIKDRFGETHRAASAGELWTWRDAPEGRLAEIIALDQFSRHIFRNESGAFSSDPIALVLAQEAVRCGADKAVDEQKRVFFYMPFMHSESSKVHEWANDLFSRLGGSRKHEDSHKKIIDRFGRYPHRNSILGRKSTLEEEEYLEKHPSFGGQGSTDDS